MATSKKIVNIAKFSGAQEWLRLCDVKTAVAAWTERDKLCHFSDYLEGASAKHPKKGAAGDTVRTTVNSKYRHGRGVEPISGHCTQRGFRDEDGSKVSRSALARDFVYNRCAADAYLFLQDTDWRKRWIIAIKRDEGPFFTVTKFTKVCSRHFTEANYLPNVAGNRRFLKQDAVPSIFAFSAPRPPPRKKPRNREPLNLVSATVPSEGGRSTTADVSDVDICSPTSVTSSIDGVVCGCACSLKISDLTEQPRQSEVKKKAEEVELTKSSLYKAERALDIAAQERSQLEKRVSRKFSVECFRDSPVYEDVSIEAVWT
ncbi:hypothetical protein HPB52_006138 [Rhipicephalus sanguineus]|uniref:THAP-type domain-containing protein n=1 Tax=Rhipicephalus sanguineus TaxID=34632 RepID=A0A9D4SXX5_RHISA|nr:hypothetical protein HPB52_006138 [Rhipicephalus sanguineus]